MTYDAWIAKKLFLFGKNRNHTDSHFFGESEKQEQQERKRHNGQFDDGLPIHDSSPSQSRAYFFRSPKSTNSSAEMWVDFR